MEMMDCRGVGFVDSPSPLFVGRIFDHSHRNTFICRVKRNYWLPTRMSLTEDNATNHPRTNTSPSVAASQVLSEPQYVSPLSTRYASKAMRENFSDHSRFRLWRRLWFVLAESQHQLGLEYITQEQLAALENAPPVDIELAQSYERQLRHDVMSHVYALGDQVPIAKPIIHLGATSCFVTDNSEVIQMRNGLDILIPMLWSVISRLSSFALKYKDLETLAFTHFQPAQPTTVGKRACLWIQDFLFDVEQLESVRKKLRLRGVKGTTGTQASFLSLFDGDHEKVKLLDDMVTKKMGFDEHWQVTGQTYTRKQDYWVVSTLAGIGQSAAKMANDIRLLQHMKEVEEPFETKQIGSSAMAYKRNPMRCERINSLARFLQSLVINPAETASTQWLERTLDDSANRRLAISEAFLSTDAILQLCLNVSNGLVVYPQVIKRNLARELPFMATETILMSAVRAGGDRQLLHEEIRKMSMEAAAKIKEFGEENDLIERIKANPHFASIHEQLEEICHPKHFVGRAPQQVEEFLQHINAQLKERNLILHEGDEVKV
ncbi:adenylosuccinate lyase [Galdieria sulphuraria]|uniref:Adenylosuccinate lyase n=1 Tax=Galdieria sulphuraria TaxID=130081 RepID=M2Y170_GALSU|nr:adenylosuccinate lyase [Galdieria sulphuraria]EME29673.1 adenylosuccinate lyase [Galdieria sulphuraria]|eukprot:XP_005706193.1 adenylosuccinate lyase [Galdieria sulphuraria]